MERLIMFFTVLFLLVVGFGIGQNVGTEQGKQEERALYEHGRISSWVYSENATSNVTDYYFNFDYTNPEKKEGK